jgi:ribosomal protein S1
MLVLGCVYEVQDYNVLVSLPGRLIGNVPVTNISSPYTKYLKDLVDGVSLEEVRYYCGNCETIL